MTKLWSLGAAALTLILVLAGIGPALAGAGPGVTVAGTELRLIDGAGGVRSGEALIGGELTLVDAYGEHRLRIESTRLDAGDPARAIRLYAFSLLDPAAGKWRELCRPGPDGLMLAFPIQGYFTDEGHYVPDPARFTITCTGGAIGKCVRFGYRPWERAPDGTSLVDLYRTCVRMIRADYCGDGIGATRNGTRIDLYDVAGIMKPETEAVMPFEAAWGPQGAICVRHTRLPGVLDLEGLVRRCPRLADKVGDACSEDAPGALFFNRSAGIAR